MKDKNYIDWKYFRVWRGASSGALWVEFGVKWGPCFGFGPGLSFVYSCGDTWWEIGGNG